VVMWNVRCIVVFLVGLMLGFFVVNACFCVFAVDEVVAGVAIGDAEGRIVVCYRAVVDADGAGANVSGLLVRLDEAGGFLSRARLAYGNGDFGSAVYYAEECQKMLEGFEGEAGVLRDNVVQQGFWDFWVCFVGSFVGAGAVVFGSFLVWRLLKKRYESGAVVWFPSIDEWRVVFLIFTSVFALVVASPGLSRVLVYPRTEFFTEFWILDSNRRADDYPFNITCNQNYSVYLGVGNRLGYCAYYLVEVKFRNQTQPSGLPSLFNITVFVGDEGVWEKPLTFSFNYTYDEMFSRVEFYDMRLNDVALDMSDYTVMWDSERNGFYGQLFFELWIYNGTASSFQYHERFVDLWLNMTVS